MRSLGVNENWMKKRFGLWWNLGCLFASYLEASALQRLFWERRFVLRKVGVWVWRKVRGWKTHHCQHVPPRRPSGPSTDLGWSVQGPGARNFFALFSLLFRASAAHAHIYSLGTSAAPSIEGRITTSRRAIPSTRSELHSFCSFHYEDSKPYVSDMFPTSNLLVPLGTVCITRCWALLYYYCRWGICLPPIEGFLTVAAAGGPPLLLLCVVLCVVRWRRALSLPQISTSAVVLRKSYSH